MSEELGHAEAPTNFARRGGHKGLLAFYIGTGVVACLFVGLHFAWTPMKVWYYGQRYRKNRQLEDLQTTTQLLLDRRATIGRVINVLGEPESRSALEEHEQEMLRYPVKNPYLSGEGLLFRQGRLYSVGVYQATPIPIPE
jgi:hypothetical protein